MTTIGGFSPQPNIQFNANTRFSAVSSQQADSVNLSSQAKNKFFEPMTCCGIACAAIIAVPLLAAVAGFFAIKKAASCLNPFNFIKSFIPGQGA